MYVTISARHRTLSDPARRYAEDRLRRLLRFEPRLLGAEVNFEAEHGVHQVEARLSVPGAPAILAQGRGEAPRVALDRAVERLGRQLKRRRERRRDPRSAKPYRTPTPAGGS